MGRRAAVWSMTHRMARVGMVEVAVEKAKQKKEEEAEEEVAGVEWHFFAAAGGRGFLPVWMGNKR